MRSLITHTGLIFYKFFFFFDHHIWWNGQMIYYSYHMGWLSRKKCHNMTFTHTRPPHRMAWSDDPPISHRMIWWVTNAYHMGWYGIYDFKFCLYFSNKVRPPQRTDGLVGSSTTYITRLIWKMSQEFDMYAPPHRMVGIRSSSQQGLEIYICIYDMQQKSHYQFLYMYIYIFIYIYNMKCNHAYGLLVVIISRP